MCVILIVTSNVKARDGTLKVLLNLYFTLGNKTFSLTVLTLDSSCFPEGSPWLLRLVSHSPSVTDPEHGSRPTGNSFSQFIPRASKHERRLNPDLHADP